MDGSDARWRGRRTEIRIGHEVRRERLRSAVEPRVSGSVSRAVLLRGTVSAMLFAFSIAPAGGGSDSVGDVVAEAVRVVRESGLPNETTSMFTTIEADSWDEGMAVVKAAVEAVQAHAPRVSLVLKADIRPGHTGQLQAKVERVEAALERE